MTPWQILQAGRAASAARDFYSQRGGGSSTAAAAAAATVDGCSSFYLSRGKMALQELNGRLAWYLQQVRDLEASNQRLEIQIQRELDRKCPSELRYLDKHLRTVCLLQQRIHEDLSVQAQLKLQLLNAELNVSGLKLRCDHENKQGRVVQEQLNRLWQLWEELQVRLPQLHDHLNHLSGQMMEMQIRHQENTQYLQAQISGGITMDIRPSQSSALTQQLDHLRRTNDMLFTETLGDTWHGNQVPGVQMSLMRPAVAFNNHEDLEFFQLELERLRRSAMILEAELTQLEAQNEVLEASGMELENTLDQELLVLEEGEDLLCHDLTSLLQASAQQAEDHHILLGVKNQLENEIHDYRRLLEGLEQQWVPGFSSRFSNPFSTQIFPSTFTHNITVKQMVSLPGRRIYMKEVQPPCGSFITVNQTSVTPMFEPVVSKVQSIKIQDLGSTGSTSERAGVPRNSHSLTDPDLNSENRPSVSVGGQPEDQKSSVICVQEIQSPDKGEVLRKSIVSLCLPDTRSKSEGQAGTDGCLVESHSVTMRTSPKPSQAPQILTRLSLYDPSKQTATEDCNETTAGIPQQNSTEDATNTPDQTSVTPMFEPVVSKVQSIKVQDLGSTSSTSERAGVPRNSHSLTDSDMNSENWPSVSVEGQPEDQKSSVIRVREIQSPDKGEVLRNSMASLSVPDTRSKSEGHTGTDGCLLESHSITMRTCTTPNQAPQILTRLSLYDLSKQTAAEGSNETTTAGIPQQNSPEDATKTPDQTSVTPIFEPVVSKVQSIKIQDLGSTSSTSERAGVPNNSHSLTDSDLNSENRPSVSVGGQPEDQKSSVICVPDIQSPDKREVHRNSIASLSVPNTQSKSEGHTDGCLVESHSITMSTSTTPNQAPQILTRLSLYDLSKQTAAEGSNETTTAGVPLQHKPEDATNTPDQTSVTPIFEPVVSKVQSIKIQDLGSTSSTSERAGVPNNSHSLTDSDMNSENRPSVLIGGQPEDQKSSVIRVWEIQSPDKGEVLRNSIASLSIPDTRLKSEEQTDTDGCLVKSPSITTKTSPKTRQAPLTLTRLSLYDLSKQTAAEGSNEMTTAGIPQQNSPEDATNTPDQDHGQIIHVTVKTEEAACETETSDTVKSSCISVEAAGSVSGPVRLIDQIGDQNQGTTEEMTIGVFKLDPPSCQKSDAEERKVVEAAAEGSSSAVGSAITSVSSGHSETKVKIMMFHSELQAKGSDVQEKSESFTSTQTGRDECLLDNKTESNTGQQETDTKTKLTKGSTEDQVQGQEVPISLEKQSEAVVVAVTVSCASGSESQSAVSVEAPLANKNQVEKLVEEAEVQAVVSGGGQSSAIKLNKALADDDKQAASAATEVLHYDDVGNITKCKISLCPDSKIESVVTKAQLEEKPGPTSVPHLEEADSTKHYQLQEESAAVAMVQASNPASQGEFLSFESFQSLRRPRPHSNTLWMVLIHNSSEDVGNQGVEEKQELHIAETKVNIRKVERQNILNKEAEQSQSLSASQCWSDRHTMTLVTEKHSTVLNATNSSGLADPESGQQLNGHLDDDSKSVMAQQEETLSPNGKSGGVFTGAPRESKGVQDQRVYSAGQMNQQEVSSTQADVKGHYGELSQVQTVSISEQSERVLTNQTAELQSGISQTGGIAEDNNKVQLQTVRVPDQSEEVITDQTELPTVNIIRDSEKVLESKTADISKESKTVVTEHRAEVQTVFVPEQSERVLTNETELLSFNTLEPMKNMTTDNPVQLQVASVTEDTEKVVTILTAESKTVSVPDPTEEVIIDQTELLSVNGIKGSEKVLESTTVSITEEAGHVLSDKTEHLQTFGIPEESETVVPDQSGEVQTISVPEQNEEVLTNQTEMLTVNTIEPSEKVLTDQSVQLEVVSIKEGTEKALLNQTAELQSVSSPEEGETALTDQTELQTANVVDNEKVLIDQPVQLQVVSKTEETENDQTGQLQTFSIPEESETAVTDQTVEVQSVSSPEESEKVLTDQTTGGSASSSGERTVVLTVEVSVNDHKEPKLNEGRPTGPNLTTSLSKYTTSNVSIPARKPEDSKTVEKSTRKEGLINESRLGFHSKTEKISTLIHRAAERSSMVENESSGVSSDKGRFSRENWIVYGGRVGREQSLNRTKSADSLSTVTLPSQVRSGSVERKDQVVDRGSPQRSNGTKGGDSLHSAKNMMSCPKGSQQTNLAGRAGRFDHEEWKVYGFGSPGHIRTWKSSDSLGKDEAVAVLTKIAVPAASVEARRLGSAASDEWRVYGGSTERISRRSSDKSIPKTVKEEVPNQRSSPEPLGNLGETVVSAESAGRVSNWVNSSIRPNADKEVTPAAISENPPTSSSGSQGAGRIGSGNSGEWRVYGGSASRLSRSSSADTVGVQASSSKLSIGSTGSSSGMSSSSHRISTSGRYASTGSVERKPVYSPASVRKNSAGSGSKLSGQSSTRISSSSRPGTASATGGRVIISSSRPIRSTGSGVGDNKERISVCKMAALSMAAAGRGRGQDQQKQEAASTPLLQQWLTSGGHQRANHERLDSSVVQKK